MAMVVSCFGSVFVHLVLNNWMNSELHQKSLKEVTGPLSVD